MESIYIYASETPDCPNCGNKTWVVNQKLERSSMMTRIDGLADIVVKPFNTNEYNEAISITCNSCFNTYQPQPGIGCTDRTDNIECYDETNEDYLGYPVRFINRNEY